MRRCNRYSRPFYSFLSRLNKPSYHEKFACPLLTSTCDRSPLPLAGFKPRFNHTFAGNGDEDPRGKLSSSELKLHGAGCEGLDSVFEEDVLLRLQELKSKDCSSAEDLEAIVQFFDDLSVQSRRKDVLLNELLPCLEVKAEQVPSGIVGTWIWLLGRLGLSTRDSKHKVLISLALKKLYECVCSENLSGKEIVLALSGLRYMRVQKGDFPPNLEISLAKELKRVTNELDCSSISKALYALPKLGFAASFIAPETRVVLLNQLRADERKSAGKDWTRVVYSLGSLGVSMNELEESERLVIDELVDKTVKAMTTFEGLDRLPPLLSAEDHFLREAIQRNGSDLFGRQLSILLKGLSGMSARWNELSEGCHRSLETAIEYQAKDLTGQHLAMVFHGLGGMSARWNELSEGCHRSLETAIEYQAKDLTSQHLAMVFHRLGGMSARWDTLSESCHRSLETAIEYQAKDLTSQGLSMVFHGLSGMSARWDTLSESCRRSLETAIEYQANDLTSQGLSMVFHGLSGMLARWNDLSQGCRRSLEATIENRAKDLTSQGLSMVFHRLGGMSARWDTLSESCHRSLETAIEYQAKDLTSQHLAMVFHGLSGMSARWDTLSGSCRRSLEAAIEYRSD
eukprot:scaffold636_cov170-Ochromonas_danica.AAC.1